ncbi:MAG: hypothetical protein E7300_01025 [Lachnospiraceae bacterium]|nr:hypothetical protein [Lachnospiraceae bacterium]
MVGYDGSIRIDTKVNSQGFNRGVASMEKGVKGLTASVGKLGAALGLVVGIAALVKIGKEAIELASDLTEVDNVVSKAFGNMRGEMDSLANTAIETLGMSRLTAYQTGSTFMSMGRSMLDSAEDAKVMALELTKLTGNMASFYNKSQDLVSLALKSVYTGETETLKQYGVVMTEVNLKQFAAEQGIKKQYSAMSQSEKVMLRYKYVMNQLAFIGDDFIDTQDSWANQTRILSERWKELLIVLGSGLTSIFSPVVKYLNDIISSLITAANTIQAVISQLFGVDMSGISLSGTADEYDGIASGAEAAADATDDYGKAVEKAGKKAKGALASFDDIKTLQQGSGGSGSAGGSGAGANLSFEPMTGSATAFDGMRDKIAKLAKALEPLINSLKRLWDEGLAKLKDFTFGTLRDFYNDFLVPVGKWMLGTGLPRLVDITNDLLNGINWGILRDRLDKFYKLLKNLAILTFDALLDFYEYFLKPVAQWVMNRALVTLLEILTDFGNKINWNAINKGLEALWKVLSKFVIGIGEGLIGFFKTMYTFLSPAIAGIINTIAEAFKALFEALDSLPVGVIEAVGGALGGMLGVFITYEAAGAIMTVLSSAWSTLAAALNAGLTALSAHPMLAIAAGIGAIIGAVSAYSEAVHEASPIGILEKEVSEAAATLSNACRDINNVLSDNSWATAGEADAKYISDLADKYFELKEKKNKSNEETARMKQLGNELVQSLPELQSFYDSETGLINTTRQAVTDLINERLREAKMSAAEGEYKKVYQEQIELIQNNKDALAKFNKLKEEEAPLADEAAAATARYNKARDEYNKKIAEGADDYLIYLSNMRDAKVEMDEANRALSEMHNTDAWKDMQSSLEDYTSSMDACGDKLKTLKDFMGDVQKSTSELPGYAKEVEKAYELAGSSAEEATKKAKAALDIAQEDAAQSGQAYGEKFGGGINSEAASAKITSSASDAANKATAALSDESVKTAAADGGKAVLDSFTTGLSDPAKIEESQGALDGWIELVREKFSEDTWGEIFAGMTTSMSDAITEMLEDWETRVGDWFDNTVSLKMFGEQTWTTFGQNMRTGMVTGFKAIVSEIGGIINKVIDIFNKALANIEDSINDLVKQFNKIARELGASTLDPVHAKPISGVSIPKLAKGAILEANHPFLAILGDQTQGRNVEAPADLIKQMVKEGLSEMNRSSQMPTSINLYLDSEKVAEMTLPGLLSEMNRQGFDLEPIGG